MGITETIPAKQPRKSKPQRDKRKSGSETVMAE